MLGGVQGLGKGEEVVSLGSRQLRDGRFPPLRGRAVVRGIRIHAGARDRVPVHPKFSGELFGSDAPKEPIRGLAKCRFHFMVADLLRTGSNAATLILCANVGESKSFGISAGGSMARSKIGKSKREAIHQRDRGRCVRCGSTNKLQIDHIIPVSKGGSNDLGNLQLMCSPCNVRKWNHLPGDSPEKVVREWCEKVFGPSACNERLGIRHTRQLVRALRIHAEIAHMAPSNEVSDG